MNTLGFFRSVFSLCYNMPKMKLDKTIVILGPTASGKTGVSIEIAEEVERRAHESINGEYCGYNGVEIISADSRAIYRGMEIGTAAPSQEEMQGIRHHGIGIVEPDERFTVADWKLFAEKKIREIKQRGNLPIIVGGTGLYIDALVYDYQFMDEKKQSQDDRKEMCINYLLIGIKWPPDELRMRITERANKLFNDELYEETKKLAMQYNWNIQAMKSNIYQFAWGYLNGEISLDKARELFVLDDWHLAKRQLTWFKRNKNINWLPLAEVKPYVLKCIQDEHRRK